MNGDLALCGDHIPEISLLRPDLGHHEALHTDALLAGCPTMAARISIVQPIPRAMVKRALDVLIVHFAETAVFHAGGLVPSGR